MNEYTLMHILCFGPMYAFIGYCMVALIVTSTPWWKRRQELLQKRHEMLLVALSCCLALGADVVAILWFLHGTRIARHRRGRVLSWAGFCVTVVIFGILMRFVP